MGRLAYKLARYVLSHVELSPQERQLFTNLILDKLDALPLHGIIKLSDEGLFINDVPVDVERARMLRDSASAALDNKALQIVSQQVMWNAIAGGLHNGDSPDKIMFYRAAIWWGQQLEAHLKSLSLREEVS